jgi:hypothetical protein
MKVGAQGVLTTAESIFRGARTRVTELAARHSASDLPLRICAGERRADSLRREGPRPHATTNAARHCRRSHRIAMRFAGVHQSGVGRKEPCPCRPGASAHRCTAEISPGRWTAAFDPRGTRSEEFLRSAFETKDVFGIAAWVGTHALSEARCARARSRSAASAS